MTALFVGIDGTGTASPRRYAWDFRHSFVRYIYLNTPATWHWYYRGPAATPLDLQSGSTIARAIADAMFNIRRALATLEAAPPATRFSMRGPIDASEDAQPRILLAGYSRGAAGVVEIARRLGAMSLRVDGMMLFDCVDRSLAIDSGEIPPNVVEVLHVRRDPSSLSRESFGNSGMRYRYPTHYRVMSFLGTHGALGGVPWTGGAADEVIDEGGIDSRTGITYARDLECAAEVWDFVRGPLARMGFITAAAASRRARVVRRAMGDGDSGGGTHAR